MNVYLRNGIVVLIANVVIFIIGWGCIVPDQINDQTHLFGLIGDVKVVHGNTATVVGVCALLSTLSMIVGLVEAIIEEYRPCRFNTPARAERPKKSPKPGVSGMRVVDPSPSKVDEDPKTPIMD